MGDKTVSVRVRFEGGDQVKAGLQEVGREGTRAMQNLGNVSSQTGARLQNAGYQVSDFFVQVAGGTAPTRALAQQLPQLLQGFGLVGVAASVLIAALPSLWALFSSGTEDAEALQNEIDGVARAVDAYGRAAELAIEPMDKLITKYGELAGSVREARVQQAELARGEASRAVNSLLEGAGPEVGFLGEDAKRIDALRAKLAELRAELAAAQANPAGSPGFDFSQAVADIENLSQRFERLRNETAEGVAEQYGITTQQALVLADGIDRVRESASQGAAEQVAAASALRSSLIEVFGSADAANQATGGLVDLLNSAVTAAADVAAVAGGIAGAVGAGADEAARLATNLAIAAATAPGGRAREGEDGRGGQGEQRRSAAVYNSSVIMDRLKPVSGRGGGGGGGGADRDQARALALTESVRTETEKYAIALEEVNRLKAKGLITDETYTRQLDKLNDKLGEVGDLGKKAASAIRSAFDGLFDDPQAALKDLAKQLAMMALYQGLAKGLPGIFGGGGVLPLIPGFAAGGRHRGGLRIVGENGPELEATGPSMIYPADALRSMARGGGGTKVEVHNYGGGQVATEEGRGPNGQQIVRVMVGKDLATGRHDGALKSRFGSRPAPVKR